MAAFEVIALDTSVPQLMAPQAGDTYTFPRAVEMPLNTANGVLFLNGGKVVSSGSALTFDGTKLSAVSTADAPVSLFGVSNSTTGGNVTLNIAAASTQYAFPSVRGDTVFRAEANSLVFGTASEFKWGSTGAEWMRLTSTGLGIGTSSPEATLTVVQSVGNAIRIGSNQTANTFKYGIIKNIAYNNNSVGVQLIGGKSDSSYTEVDIGGGVDGGYAVTQIGFFTAANTTTATGSERMRLDSSGNLGIGTSSPSVRLMLEQAANSAPVTLLRLNNSGTTGGGPGIASRISFTAGATALGFIQGSNFASGAAGLQFSGDGTNAQATLDSSGNLGLGVTPSAWGNEFNAFHFGGSGASIASYKAAPTTSEFAYFISNAYNDNLNWIYVRDGLAANYRLLDGTHAWFTAPSGTAGNTISFTQAMTLDASGRLLIGQTADKTQEVVRVSSSGQASLLLDNTGKTNGSFVGVFNDAALFAVNRNPSTGVFYNVSNYAAEIVAVGSSSTSYIAFSTAAAANTTPTERARILAAGGMVVGTAALATAATDGFLYVPTCAGTPTGTPTTQTGTAPIVVDTTNNKLYFYSGGQWRDAGP